MRKKTQFNYRIAFRLALLSLIVLVLTLASLLSNLPVIAQQQITPDSPPTLEPYLFPLVSNSFRLSIPDDSTSIYIDCGKGYEPTFSDGLDSIPTSKTNSEITFLIHRIKRHRI